MAFTLTVAMRAEVRDLIAGFRAAAGQARTLADRTDAANRSLARLDANAARAASQLHTVGNSSRSLVRDLNRVASRAGAARSNLRAMGADGARSVSQLDRSLGAAGQGLTLLSGGGLLLGANDLLQEGNRYQRGMNLFRAVSSAAGSQMKRAADTAQELGNDLSLPGSTAADAAEGMVELSKAGFRADQSIDSVRASLQLASAADVNAALSARYLGDIMDQYGLGAEQASRAADTLAATSNAASGSITDIYYSMRYAGPVAAGLGVTLQDTAAAVGMLGRAGILGTPAGTAMRGIFSNLAAPTPKMKGALGALSIEAWDDKGQFRGLRNLIDELNRAQHEMNPKEFTGAVTQAFGKPALSGALALAHQGTESFDDLSLAVRQTGAAATITASRGQGLAGAMTQLRTQTRQTGIALYNGMAPGLEYVTRLLTRGMSGATPYLTTAIEYGTDLARLYGPDLKQQASSGLGELVDEARALVGPLKALGEDTLATGLNLLINAAETLGDVLGNAADGAEPVLDSLGDIVAGGGAAAGTLDIVTTAVNLVFDAVSGLSTVLVPIGQVVGGLVSAFAALPGPIQSAALAMLLFRRVQPGLMNLAGTVTGPVRGAFQGFAQQMQLQRTLAASSGVALNRYGAAWAAVQSRVGFLGNMTAAFRSANGAGTTFIGTLNGVGRAAGSGLRSAMSGLSGALGGPWGIAIAGAMVGLSLLASRQQRAAQAAAEHEQRVSSLTSALRESGGAVNANVRVRATEILMDTKVRDGKEQLVRVMERAGVPMDRLTDAYLGQGTSLDSLQRQLNQTAESNVQWITSGRHAAKVYTDTGLRAKRAADALGGIKGEMSESVKRAKQLADVQRGAGGGTSAYDRLKTAVSGLADETADADQRTRSLKDALDLLSGGQVSLQAARARVNAAVLDLREGGKDVDRQRGYGGDLVNPDKTINTTSRNGQQLYSQLTSLSDAAADATMATYSLAKQNGESLPDALSKARGEMSRARTEAIRAARGYGLTRTQAEAVANSLGLLPSQVSILLQTQGMDSTLANLFAVQAEFRRLPKARTIKVDSVSEDAQKKLRELGFTVKTVPGTRQIKITAPTAVARKSLDELVAQLGRTPNAKNVRVSARSAAAIASLQAVQSEIRATPGAKWVRVAAPTAQARKELESLGFKIEEVPGTKDVKVTIPTGGPIEAVQSIQSRIDGMRGKTIDILINRRSTSWDRDANGTPDSIQAPPVPQADGGVLDFFADGGVTGPRRERHVAQIAPAGSWRIWGEPEAKGEAYVPLATSKRERSKAVVEEVVDRFGGEVQWFANGGLTRRASRDYGSVIASFKKTQNVAALADAVRRFDVRSSTPGGRPRLVDARAGGRVQVLVVREQQPLIGTMPVTVTDSSATPEQIGSEMMRNLRNAQRGGRVG
ncbi:phage tail tape measure protein [Streptomyces jumonjinensis]|uniref:phage tail tape measure protein n=1 Tax=Streptomyces jumonjinensis TaxID=1945 RepID=UPI0033282E07